ncbi:hypothetical protein VPH35_043308 [Triticum aestivum]
MASSSSPTPAFSTTSRHRLPLQLLPRAPSHGVHGARVPPQPCHLQHPRHGSPCPPARLRFDPAGKGTPAISRDRTRPPRRPMPSGPIGPPSSVPSIAGRPSKPRAKLLCSLACIRLVPAPEKDEQRRAVDCIARSAAHVLDWIRHAPRPPPKSLPMHRRWPSLTSASLEQGGERLCLCSLRPPSR